ncbi:hypothetical protein GCM10027090_12720 [Sinomonas soli]
MPANRTPPSVKGPQMYEGLRVKGHASLRMSESADALRNH